MTLIRQLINAKGSDIWSVSPTDTVFEALQQLADKNVGALLVQDNGSLSRHYF